MSNIIKHTNEFENVKYCDVFICDAYLKNNVVHIPHPEATHQPFYDAVLKGTPKSFLIVINKN